MASKEMKEIAMIDHAEFSKLAISHSSMLVSPAYFFSTSPDAFETNTACIFIPAEFPATVFPQKWEYEILEKEKENYTETKEFKSYTTWEDKKGYIEIDKKVHTHKHVITNLRTRRWGVSVSSTAYMYS